MAKPGSKRLITKSALLAVLATIFLAPVAMGADDAPVSLQLGSSILQDCGYRRDIVHALDEKFKEKPQAIGQVNKDAVIEIYVSTAGTWTIIATGTDGTSCLVSAGDGWQSTSFVAGKDS